MPYPWTALSQLTHQDLNSAFAAILNTPVSITLNWPAIAVNPGTYVLTETLPYGITFYSVDANIGSNAGTITATYRANGLTIAALGVLTVTQPSKTNLMPSPGTTTAVPAGQTLDVVIAITSGLPIDTVLTLNGFRT